MDRVVLNTILVVIATPFIFSIFGLGERAGVLIVIICNTFLGTLFLNSWTDFVLKVSWGVCGEQERKNSKYQYVYHTRTTLSKENNYLYNANNTRTTIIKHFKHHCEVVTGNSYLKINIRYDTREIINVLFKHNKTKYSQFI